MERRRPARRNDPIQRRHVPGAPDRLLEPEYDRLVWTPDALGSICFLVSGYLAYVAVCGRLRARREREWQIAAVNLLGCVAFGVAAVAAFVVPKTGGVVDLAAANAFTSFGGLCFLVGRDPAPAGGLDGAFTRSG